MKVNLRASGLVVLALAAVCPVATARDLDQDQALRLRQKGLIAPLEQLLGPALQRYPGGRLLEAELEEHKDGAVRYRYEIELLTVDGVVREIELDANTGELLKDKEDD